MTRKTAIAVSVLGILIAVGLLISTFGGRSLFHGEGDIIASNRNEYGKPGQVNYLGILTDAEGENLQRVLVLFVNTREETWGVLDLQPNLLCEVPIIEDHVVREYAYDALSAAYLQTDSKKENCVYLQKAVVRLLKGREMAGFVQLPWEVAETLQDNLEIDLKTLFQLQDITSNIGITGAISLGDKLKKYSFTEVNTLPGVDGALFEPDPVEAEKLIEDLFF